MKKILLILFLFGANIYSPTINASTTVPGGNVYGTWTLSGSPYNVTGHITVPVDSTLTIQPGVSIVFQGHYKLNVQGKILAIGTAVDSVVFTAANTTTGWWGVRFVNTSSTQDSSIFKYCKLQWGKANGSGDDINGGAFFFNGFSKAMIFHSLILNNTATAGGGIYCKTNAAPLILRNVIYNNSVLNIGGGILCQNADPTITCNKICNNSSANDGGGINFFASRSVLRGNDICNNTAQYTGGGLSFNSGLVQNPEIYNCTISNNLVSGSCCAGGGGGVYLSGSCIPNFVNTIIWGNISNMGNGDQVDLDDDPSDPSFDHCDIQGGSIGFFTNGNPYTGAYTSNINSNPMFVSPSGGVGTGFNGLAANWSITTTSPCKDSGTPNPSSLNLPATDLAGNARITTCTIDIGAHEFQYGVPFNISIAQIATIPCNGYSTAALQVTATGGTPSYIYSWSTGGTNSSISNLGAGTYTVTVTDASSCVRTSTFTITQPAGMTLTPSHTNIDCSGNCIGTASVSVSGGTGPYTYSWTTTPSQSTNSVSALCSGTYRIIVTDASGCSKTDSVTITTPSSLSFTTVNVNVSCFGGNNGNIVVSANGGTAPYQYSKDGGTNYQSSTNFTGLIAGTYNIVVKDNAGCQTSIITVMISQPPILTLSTTQINVNCFGGTNGSATAIASGGTPPYSYSWNTSPAQTGSIATGLSPGNYTIYLTDNHSCTATSTVNIISTIPQPSICLVTVDSLSQYNNILWDKTIFGTAVDSFIIYREITTNNYFRIGAVPYSAFSLFVDTVRTLYFPNTGNPNTGTFRYKVQARDTCGSLSAPLSLFHNTIYITNSNGTFSWPQLYTIESSANPVSSYNLERDDNSNGTWHVVNSVAGTQQTVADPFYSTWQATASWRVSTVWSISCIPTLIKDNVSIQAVNKSHSNSYFHILTDINRSELEKMVNVFPNPSSGKFNIQSSNLSVKEFEVRNLIGELIITDKCTKQKRSNEIDLSYLGNGIYFLSVIADEGTVVKKIAIAH